METQTLSFEQKCLLLNVKRVNDSFNRSAQIKDLPSMCNEDMASELAKRGYLIEHHISEGFAGYYISDDGRDALGAAIKAAQEAPKPAIFEPAQRMLNRIYRSAEYDGRLARHEDLERIAFSTDDVSDIVADLVKQGLIEVIRRDFHSDAEWYVVTQLGFENRHRFS